MPRTLASLFCLALAVPSAGATAPYPEPDLGQVPTYSLTVDLRPPDGRVAIEGTVRLPVGPAALPELVLSINKAFRRVRLAVVDPPPADNPATVAEHGGFTDYLLRPARPFEAGREVVVGFAYELDPTVPVSYFHAGPDGAFGSGINVAWYPQVQQPAGRPEGVGEVRFRQPPGWTVVANGRQPAASRAQGGPAVFSFALPTAFAFAAGRLQGHSASAGPPVEVLLLSARAYADDYAMRVQRVLGFYDQEFGPFPYESFAVVEVPEDGARRSGFTGQSESGMIWVTPRYLERPFSFAYYGHEIGHQWWGQLVSKRFDSDSGVYMPDEAVAQWGSLQVVAAFEGEAAAERYRRTGYPGYSSLQNGLGYLSLLTAGIDEVIDGPRRGTSHLVANSKGFLVLDHLAELIGRDRFAAALRGFLRRYAYRSASWPELKSALQAAASQDLSWFMEQWFSRPGAPDWSLQWQQEGGIVSGAVTQAEPYYRATVEVVAAGEECGQRSLRLEVRGPSTPFEVAMPCPAQSVALDPHFRVLRWTPEYRALARAHVPFAHWAISDSYPALHDEIAGLLDTIETPDLVGLAFALHHDLARVHQYEQRWPPALAELRAAVSSPVRPRDELPWVYASLALAASKVGDLETMRTASTAARTADALATAPTGAVERVMDPVATRPP